MSTPSKTTANLKPTKVVIPKVWKRPHSTIYGKNVEFGSKLTSDKLGEINGRKFNSELPWTMRNSGGSSSTSGSSTSQGYLSKLLNEPQSTLIGSVITSKPPVSSLARGVGGGGGSGSGSGGSGSSGYSLHEDRVRLLTPSSCSSYADVLELTNPNRYSKRRASISGRSRLMHDRGMPARRIDFYENYLDDFNDEIRRQNESSRILNDPLMQRRALNENLDFNYELGLFVPSGSSSSRPSSSSSATRDDDDGRSLMRKKTLLPLWDTSQTQMRPSSSDDLYQANHNQNQHYHRHDHYQYPVYSGGTGGGGYSYNGDDTSRPTLGAYNNQPKQLQHRRPSYEHETDINPAHFNPVVTTTKQTNLLPKHACQLAASPYGQSADGRKLSLGSINPHSYRPSLPHKTTTVHSSDGEEFEFQDKSSPFYTDRWAGKTIRHFDSDLYSNANLFKSMIL